MADAEYHYNLIKTVFVFFSIKGENTHLIQLAIEMVVSEVYSRHNKRKYTGG